MKRTADQNLLAWYQKSGRKPLVIRGARQVGKSTLVRNFAHDHGIDLVEVNLERNRRLDALFAAQKLTDICREIEFITDKSLSADGTKLLFLDEIQATPAAIPCLRYFYEEMPQLPVVSAGSLLEFVLAKHNFEMPVGRVDYLFLGPMSFREYLLAHGQDRLLGLIDGFAWNDTFPDAAHDRLLDALREFFVVGGMPEAVAKSVEDPDIGKVLDVQASICETYQDDFGKYARDSQLALLQNLFRYVPVNAGAKVKYAGIDPHRPARQVREAIDLLVKAGVLYRVTHSDASGMPLNAGADPSRFKLYFLDVGLLNFLCGTKHIPPEAIRQMEFINKGNVAEQFIAQHVYYGGRGNCAPELFYWLREGRTGNAEVDFLAADDRGILPIEVKAGQSGSLKSLHQFVLWKKTDRAVRYDLNKPSRQTVVCAADRGDGIAAVEFAMTSLPLYMVHRSDLW
jgi:predicted AAA+ superfamily ATPase